jgi:hypothetical protein
VNGPLSSGDSDRVTAFRALRRLVSFVAAALDVRFAFVAAFHEPESSRVIRNNVSLWLAKDFGLRSEFVRVELPEALPHQAVSADWTRVLRHVWPDEQELAESNAVGCITVALYDPRERVVGHLGLLDSGPGSRLSQWERLRPLGRPATAELMRWLGGRDPRE